MTSRTRRNYALNKLNASSTAVSRRHRPDYWIVIISVLLLTIGLVVVYSISPGLAASQHISQNYFITKQIIDVVLGMLGFTIAAFVPTTFWRRCALPLLIMAILASVVVMFMPLDDYFRAHRWIRVGGYSFQVAELIKFAVLVWAAGFLTNSWKAGKLNDLNATIKPLIITFLAIAVVVVKLQSDLGSACVIISMLAFMAFAAGMPLKRIVIFGSLILILLTIAISTSPYRRERLVSFVHPQADCQDAGYQACQALISVGSGGLFGLGLGYSVQAYGYLPEASDDSIFAIMAEKFGFIGTTLIVVLYAIFFRRIQKIILHTGDQFNRLLLVGVLAWISTQTIINIGAMLGMLPLKGITLPLISQGGTSLVFLTAALGIVFNISRYTNYNVTELSNIPVTTGSTDNSVNGWRLRRPHNTPLVTRPRT